MSNGKSIIRYLKFLLLDSVSVRAKLMGIYLFIAFLFTIWVTYYTQSILYIHFQDQLKEQGFAIARDLAARSEVYIFTDNSFGMNELMRDAIEHNEKIIYIIFQDRNSMLITSSFRNGIPRGMLDANYAEGREGRLQLLKTEYGWIWDVAIPIAEPQVGYVRVGLTETQLNIIIRLISTNIALGVIIISVVASIFAFMLQVIITEPIMRLVTATKEVASGNFQYRVNNNYAKDEIGQLVNSFNYMAEKLSYSMREMQTMDNMRRLLLEKVINIQEQERKRIAIELHDETGQLLTGLKFNLKILENMMPANGLKEKVNTMHIQISETLESIHNLTLELGARILNENDLGSTLRAYAKDYQNRYGINVTLAVEDIDDCKLMPEVATSIFRIFQEALTNAAKYSQAENIVLTLKKQDDILIAMIEDDGIGFVIEQMFAGNSLKNKLGLFGMQERAHLLGGVLRIDSEPDAGTTIYLRTPLKGVVENE
jgi:signal transduction histidine kinase